MSNAMDDASPSISIHPFIWRETSSWLHGEALTPNSPHVVGGLMNMSTFNLERWQLRTRGFFPSDAWNACAPNGTITPNFSGLLAARFTFSVQ